MNWKINLPGFQLNNIVYNGAGSFQYGEYQWAPFAKASNFEGLSVLTLKTTSWKAKQTSNDWSELMYVSGQQTLNSIGLQCPDANITAQRIQALAQKVPIPLIASLSGDTVQEFVQNTSLITKQPVVALELNLSCPNISKGGLAFGLEPESVHEVVSACKKKATKPLYVKLTPNVTDITVLAQAAEQAGADAIIAINTFKGLMLNPDNHHARVIRGYGGYSGPGVFPIALRMVHEIYKTVNIPIIALGGISKAQDVVDMLAAGATACQVTSACLNDQNFFVKLNQAVDDRLATLGITDLKELRGIAHTFPPFSK